MAPPSVERKVVVFQYPPYSAYTLLWQQMRLATSWSEPHRKGRCASEGHEPKAAGKAGVTAAGVTATSSLPVVVAGAVAVGAVAVGAAASS